MGKKIKRSRKVNGFFKPFVVLGKSLKSIFPWMISISLVAGLFLGVKQVLYADTFLRVKSVDFYPALSVSSSKRAEVESRFIGKSILTVQLPAIAKNLEKDPAIRSAHVVRRFPSHLAVEIIRREPLVNVQFSQKNKYALISDDGVILELMVAPKKDFLVVELPLVDEKKVRLGSVIPQKGFSQLDKFLKAYWSSDIAENYPLTRILIDERGNYSIYFAGSPEIKLGRYPPERLDAIGKIVHLLQDKEIQKISYIDLQYDHVIVKKKG